MRWVYCGYPGRELTERPDSYRVAARNSDIVIPRPTGSWAITGVGTCGPVFPAATHLHSALAPGR
ncbi:hypothetical protein [Nocardia africana]|uniref:hypothetical protein n=1 Tax=Nocardia africana TaxID=134964 RepID=UPI000B180EF8|nr:hypothetical protein [Nocardia africana]MCC3314301.1 hypothetical protein [Nocardia africana]